MYNSFYGFTEKPFDVTPDPDFLYLTPGHREALGALLYGIQERRGFIALIGEVGTGKTTLIKRVLAELNPSTKVAYLFNTEVSFYQLLMMALSELGLTDADTPIDKVNGLDRLNDFALRQLSEGGNVVLIVDEAQNLDRKALENLRLLSNLETRKQKLIQIVLSGQPELDATLSHSGLRQLQQRISLKRYITPLNETETYDYIRHRLNQVHYKGRSLFSRKARHLIWEYSGGVPRKINILCDNALLIGFAGEKKKIKPGIIAEAVTDLTWSPLKSDDPVQIAPPEKTDSRRKRRFVFGVGLVISLVLAFFTGMMFRGGQPRFSVHFNPYRAESPLTAGNTENTDSPLGVEKRKNSKQSPAIELQPGERVRFTPAILTASTEREETRKSFSAPVMEAAAFSAGPTDSTASPSTKSPTEDKLSDSAQEKKPHRAIAGDSHSFHTLEALHAVIDAREAGRKNIETVREEEMPVHINTLAVEIPNTEDGEPSDSALSKQETGIRIQSEKRGRVSNTRPNPGSSISYDSRNKSADKAIGNIPKRNTIVVKRGESLSRIIFRVYGGYAPEKLKEFLKSNPQIKNPDFLIEGQVLYLPPDLKDGSVEDDSFNPPL